MRIDGLDQLTMEYADSSDTSNLYIFEKDFGY